MNIKEAILNVLNGDSLDNAIDDLVLERRVCRYQGAPQKRVTKRGRIYYVRKRVCQGRASPTLGRRVSRAMRRGGSPQRRKRSQIMRWRGSLKRQNSPLPGERITGARRRRIKKR